MTSPLEERLLDPVVQIDGNYALRQEAADRIVVLEAECDRLKAALRPFAEAAERYSDAPDEMLFCLKTVDRWLESDLRLGDLRHARATLTEEGGDDHPEPAAPPDNATPVSASLPGRVDAYEPVIVNYPDWESGIREFVLADRPTITRSAGNYDELIDMETRRVIGFLWPIGSSPKIAAGLPGRATTPADMTDAAAVGGGLTLGDIRREIDWDDPGVEHGYVPQPEEGNGT